MRPFARYFLVLVSAMLLVPCVTPAQRHVPDDSTGFSAGVISRLLWRDITLADAPGLQSGVALPFRLLVPLEVEFDGATALADKPHISAGNQYRGAVHYQWIFADRPHPKSVVLGYAEIWNPHLDQLGRDRRERTREVSAAGLFEIGIPSEGIRTIHFELDAARDLARENATWVRGSANMSMGITIPCTDTDYSLTAILRAAVAASDVHGSLITGPRPAFGFHSADLGMDIQIRNRFPLKNVGATTTFQLGGVFRAKRLGANLGWVGVREAVLLN